ncbi:MAG: CsbD family protein [Polyangia bacterium]
MGELIDKIKGKAKQAEGRVTGDRGREAEGVADELKGKAKGAFEELKTDAKRAIRQNENPPPANPSRR